MGYQPRGRKPKNIRPPRNTRTKPLRACFFCDRPDAPDDDGRCKGCGAPRITPPVGALAPRASARPTCDTCRLPMQVVSVQSGFPRVPPREFARCPRCPDASR